MYDAAPSTAPLQLNTLLELASIDPSETIVVRHGPQEPALRRVLPWLVIERPEVFNHYQALQNGALGRSLSKARYMVSFIGMSPRQAVLAGLYEVAGARSVTEPEFWAMAGSEELKGLGMKGVGVDEEVPSALAYLDLRRSPLWDGWTGKLVVDWPPPDRSWWRQAARNEIRVRSIAEESRFAAGMPSWNALVLTWEQLKLMPASWRVRLAEWRGIYFIYDAARQAGYVGSACGPDNILGRWLGYADSGHGGNVKLRISRPEDLRFSILQRTSPDTPAADVLALEAGWKQRLHTRDFGLNAN